MYGIVSLGQLKYFKMYDVMVDFKEVGEILSLFSSNKILVQRSNKN